MAHLDHSRPSDVVVNGHGFGAVEHKIFFC